MSELRVDNIVSEDGTAAPVYSKGMTIGAGQTLTCTGDFSVGGNVTFDSGATVTGVVTFSSADLQTNLSLTSLSVSGVSSVGSAITMYGTSGIVSATSFYGDGSNLTGIDSTALVDSGNTTRVQANTSGAVVTGILTATSFSGTGITWLDTQNTGSGGAITVTGINTNARMIVISLFRVSQSSSTNNHLTLRVGNGSINTGSNYYWSVGRGVDATPSNTAQTYYRLIVSAYTNASFLYSGNITLLRTDDVSNLWSISHLLSENGGGNEPIYGAGSFNDTVIDRVQLIPEGSFDNGRFRVGYML